MTASGVFITGTDTGVGKTRVATGLCQAYADLGRRVAAMKPVSAGCSMTPAGLSNADALALGDAATVRCSYSDLNPYAFEAPIAPHIAAADAGVDIDLEVLDRAYRRLAAESDVVVVEGAGGFLVPVGPAASLADLAVMWQLDVVLVVGLRLGCLNHALLTLEAIERRGLRLAGWVGNAIEAQFPRRAENLDALGARLGAPCLASLEFAPQAGRREIAAVLRRNIASLCLA